MSRRRRADDEDRLAELEINPLRHHHCRPASERQCRCQLEAQVGGFARHACIGWYHEVVGECSVFEHLWPEQPENSIARLVSVDVPADTIDDTGTLETEDYRSRLP